jgi:hypothetical protein
VREVDKRDPVASHEVMLDRLRTRYLLAMGLPLLACATKEPTASVDVPAPTPSARPEGSATAAPSASASVAPVPPVTPSAVASTTPSATPSATPPPARPTYPPTGAFVTAGLPSTVESYPFNNGRGCSSRTARCFLLKDLKSAACPTSADVPRGCMDGGACTDPNRPVAGALMPAISKSATAKNKGATCCYEEPDNCCAVCGRALREGAVQVTTAVQERADWVRELAVGATTRGEAFREMAGAEHASIASFARTTLDLLALGAPPELLAETQRATLDEIDHARTMYALASAALGTKLGPAPLAVEPQAAPTLAGFAVATLRDACIGETRGVVVLRAMAEREDEPIARALRRIADDEERHAALAFQMVAWALRTGGAPVAEALSTALAALEPDPEGVTHAVVAPCIMQLLAAA